MTNRIRDFARIRRSKFCRTQQKPFSGSSRHSYEADPPLFLFAAADLSVSFLDTQLQEGRRYGDIRNPILSRQICIIVKKLKIVLLLLHTFAQNTLFYKKNNGRKKHPLFLPFQQRLRHPRQKSMILHGEDGGKTEAEFTFDEVYVTILFKTSMNGKKYTGCMTCIGEEAACSAS